MKTTIFLRAVMTILIAVTYISCSKSDPATVEPEPDFGTLTAHLDGVYRVFQIIEPWGSHGTQQGKNYVLQGRSDFGNQSLTISLTIPDSIAKPGSYNLDHRIWATIRVYDNPCETDIYGNPVGCDSWQCETVVDSECKITFSIFTQDRAKGTFEINFPVNATCRGMEITNGRFDINRE